MRKILLITRKKPIVIEESSENKLNSKRRKPIVKEREIEITSVIAMSRRIDEFERYIRKKMKNEMIVFSAKIHSQEFLRSLVPSLNKKRDEDDK